MNAQFPRDLTPLESEYLNYLLPEGKKGYKLFKDQLKDLKVVAKGNLSDTSFVICKQGFEPDPEDRTGSVFAYGIINFENNNSADVTISRLSEDCSEFDISFKQEFADQSDQRIIKYWSYSDWSPGEKAPGDNSDVLEVVLSENEYILVIAPAHKKMWVHELKSGINYLIPVSNYYTNLMMVKGIRDPEKALKPSLFFQESGEYSSEELKRAFILYNRYFNKFKISAPKPEEKGKEKRSLLSYFKRG